MRISFISVLLLSALSLTSCGNKQTENTPNIDTTKVLKDSVADSNQSETGDEDSLTKEQIADAIKAEKEYGVSASGVVGVFCYVDLGLKSGTKWATSNVGANEPSEWGLHYAWGETKSHDLDEVEVDEEVYTWKNYKWSNGNEEKVTKYCTQSEEGVVDGLKTLEPADDVATVKWGKKWRMPTEEEWEELIAGCKWAWTKDFNGSGHAGRIGTSKTNGNIIFLPAAYQNGVQEFCRYWSSTLDNSSSLCAIPFDFDSEGVLECEGVRYTGRNIRAVVK